jgi:hypothetical protein
MNLRHVSLAAAILVSTPANAATYVITYTGTVSGGYAFDHTGVFGEARRFLSGLEFIAVYTLQAPLPGASTIDTGIHGSIYSWGKPSPVSATLTIDGVTRAIAGDTFSSAMQSNLCCSPGIDLVKHEASDRTGDYYDRTYINNRIENSISSAWNNFISTPDYTSSLNYTAQPNDDNVGSFSFFGQTDYVVDSWATGFLVAKHVTIVKEVAGVPEPTTWATMILGMGIVGGAMRRSRQKARVRYSLT